MNICLPLDCNVALKTRVNQTIVFESMDQTKLTVDKRKIISII